MDVAGTALRALTLYSLAEFQSGHATTIAVTAEGRSIGIADDGRGHSIDRTVEGDSYLNFIYTHFDYPFRPGPGTSVQLHGIGMSLVNALCSELVLTVHTGEETLELSFRDGRLDRSRRTAARPGATGNAISARIRPQLQRSPIDSEPLEAWLRGVLAAHPSLRLFFNGRELQAGPA